MKPQRQMLADIRAAPRDEQRRVVARRDGPTPWETEGEGLPDDLPEEERVLDAMGSEEDGRETPSESFPDKTPRAEENSSSSEGVGGMLIERATAGAASHSHMKGVATAKA